MLPWIPRLVHTPATVDLSLPLRPWVPESTGVGGYEESAAGIGSAWEYRRDEALRLRLRAWEYEWPAVRDWIAAGQRAQSIEINLCQVGPSTPVRLVSPRMGEPIVPTLTETPGVWEVEVVVRPVSGTLYEPYYDELSGVNLLRNPGFEDSVPGYAPYWDPAPSRNLLGPDAGVETVVQGTTSLVYIGSGPTGAENAEPLSVRGVRPGGVVSLSYDARVEGGATASRLTFRFYDAAGAEISEQNAGPTVSGTEWTPAGLTALTIPAAAVSWILVARYTTGGPRYFRRVMLNHSATRLAYEAPSHVVYDPARAYSGSRFLQLAAAPGAIVRADPRDLTGAFQYYPVRPGDVVDFGGWVVRSRGDGLCRLRLATYADMAGADPTYNHSPAITATAYTETSAQHVVAAGKAALRVSLQVSDATTLTTARFDDVYLRIKRGGPR